MWDYDDNGYTPLRLWIKEKVDEPIPEILKYPGWEKTKDIKTLSIPLHDWVLNRIGDR